MKKKNSENNKEKIVFDKELLRKFQPQGGISFKDERYIKTGDGYEACVHIYTYPKLLDMHWLATAININNTVSVIDIATDNIIEVRKNINKSMKEHKIRFSTATDATEAKDAQQRYQELDRLYDEITELGEIIKLIHIRLLVSGKSIETIENEIVNVQTYLESNGYKSAIFLNEGKNEWLSMYLSAKEQDKNEYNRRGQEVSSETLAGGNPFHFTSLADDCGTYLGTTVSTGGSVLFDPFTATKKRMSYNSLCVGKMGSGKSTTLKKLVLDMAVRGNYVRGFDPTGEFAKLVDYLGGKIISLDGSDGILNALEVLRTDEEETTNFARHISKLTTIYKFLVPTADSYEILGFEETLREFYIDFGLISDKFNDTEKQVTNLPATSYPIFSDFLKYIDREIATAEARGDIQKELLLTKMQRLYNTRLVISNLVNNYGYMFDGHTSTNSIATEQIVFFNIKNLMNISSEIFDAQIFTALSLCWDNCIDIGSRQKQLFESGGLDFEDVTRFMVFIDEAHRIINTNKIHAVEQLTTFAREARKYFGGLMYASQSIRDFVPESSSNENIDKIKVLFELTQYKFIMNQDSNTLNLMERVFQNELASSELSQIPKLEKGECILSIASDKNIHFKIDLSDQEADLFTGGV